MSLSMVVELNPSTLETQGGFVYGIGEGAVARRRRGDVHFAASRRATHTSDWMRRASNVADGGDFFNTVMWCESQWICGMSAIKYILGRLGSRGEQDPACSRLLFGIKWAQRQWLATTFSRLNVDRSVFGGVHRPRLNSPQDETSPQPRPPRTSSFFRPSGIPFPTWITGLIIPRSEFPALGGRVGTSIGNPIIGTRVPILSFASAAGVWATVQVAARKPTQASTVLTSSFLRTATASSAFTTKGRFACAITARRATRRQLTATRSTFVPFAPTPIMGRLTARALILLRSKLVL
ncbi:hypothetical protein C8R46DRAFT_1040605 [Mycena filopes]|nr:hypothetical protein C8R46DRAFT_1040605 [Mycena filopes]